MGDTNKNASTASAGDLSNPQEDDVLQVVFIDFGQAVDRNHPSANDYLRRDVDRVHSFFHKIGGVSVLSADDAYHFITTYEGEMEEELKCVQEDDEDWEVTPMEEDDYVIVEKEH